MGGPREMFQWAFLADPTGTPVGPPGAAAGGDPAAQGAGAGGAPTVQGAGAEEPAPARPCVLAVRLSGASDQCVDFFSPCEAAAAAGAGTPGPGGQPAAGAGAGGGPAGAGGGGSPVVLFRHLLLQGYDSRAGAWRAFGYETSSRGRAPLPAPVLAALGGGHGGGHGGSHGGAASVASVASAAMAAAAAAAAGQGNPVAAGALAVADWALQQPGQVGELRGRVQALLGT